MKRIKDIRIILGISLLCATTISLLSFQTDEKEKTVLANESTEGIQWITVEEAVIKHKEEPKMWLIDVWTDWCGWCKKMEKTTFSDPYIGEFVNENYYAVSFNAEQKEDIVIDGHTYKFVNEGQRGYHELARELLGEKMTYPTVVFLTKDRKIMTQAVGYRTKEDFLPLSKFLFQYDPLNPSTLEDYKKTFVSPYTVTTAE